MSAKFQRRRSERFRSRSETRALSGPVRSPVWRVGSRQEVDWLDTYYGSSQDHQVLQAARARVVDLLVPQGMRGSFLTAQLIFEKPMLGDRSPFDRHLGQPFYGQPIHARDEGPIAFQT